MAITIQHITSILLSSMYDLFKSIRLVLGKLDHDLARIHKVKKIVEGTNQVLWTSISINAKTSPRWEAKICSWGQT